MTAAKPSSRAEIGRGTEEQPSSVYPRHAAQPIAGENSAHRRWRRPYCASTSFRESTDQTLAIYSGDELLLTTPLQPAHLGDTLRFNCPISAGEHALRVVLYRGDKTVLMHKENNSELHADGTNNMQVRVNRKAKMLVKHETSLEVVWPSSTAATM